MATAYLRKSYVEGLVGDDPGDRLVAAGHREGAVVGEVLVGGGQQVAHPQLVCRGGGPCMDGDGCKG